MNSSRHFAFAALTVAAFAAPLAAQTQLVRGDVDAVQNTNGIFVLDCTSIPLVSSAVNLQAMHDLSQQQDIEFEMQVRNIGTAQNPVLDVVSAVQIPEIFGMGNLRFGRSETWEVLAAPGTPAAMFVDHISATGYTPYGAAGTWVLGPNALLLASGTTSGIGRFQIRFTMPTMPAMLGQTFVGQALFADANGLTLTNPDCKEVRD